MEFITLDEMARRIVAGTMDMSGRTVLLDYYGYAELLKFCDEHAYDDGSFIRLGALPTNSTPSREAPMSEPSGWATIDGATEYTLISTDLANIDHSDPVYSESGMNLRVWKVVERG